MIKPTEYNTSLPSWLADNINKRCPYCGAHIVDNELLTQRYCINQKCYGHMSRKMDILAKRFNIKGFGPASALSYCNLFKPENHLEILRSWFPNEKPLVELWEAGDMSMIYGYGPGEWKNMALGFKSFNDMIDNGTDITPTIYANRAYLNYCEGFFRIKEPFSRRIINVMITGSVTGFSNREQYIQSVNKTFGKYIQTIQVGKRASGVSFLISEQGVVGSSKTEVALRNGIPIITPIEYVKYLGNLLSERSSL